MRGTNLETFYHFPYVTPLGSHPGILSLSPLSPCNSFLLKTHDHSPMARAMHSAIRPARLNDKFQDPLYLFLELVRAGVMHGHLWSGRAFSGGPSFGTGTFVVEGRGCSHVQARWLLMERHVLTDDEKSCMLLVMRTLSIVPLNFKVCVLCALCQAKVEVI